MGIIYYELVARDDRNRLQDEEKSKMKWLGSLLNFLQVLIQLQHHLQALARHYAPEGRDPRWYWYTNALCRCGGNCVEASDPPNAAADMRKGDTLLNSAQL